MRKIMLSAAVAAFFVFSAAAQSAQSSSSSSAASADQPDSLAAAARKARDQKKDAPKKTAKVYTNDDMPASGGISTVGAEAPPEAARAGAADASAGDKSVPAKAPNEEKAWRDKFT